MSLRYVAMIRDMEGVSGLCTGCEQRSILRVVVILKTAATRLWHSSARVQQPCSNPSKSPDMLRIASKQKYSNLQAFCKLQKPLAKYLAAFARRRSGVRIPSAPLRLFANLGEHGANAGGDRSNTGEGEQAGVEER